MGDEEKPEEMDVNALLKENLDIIDAMKNLKEKLDSEISLCGKMFKEKPE